ncbi:hypothetical protein [Heyndrickxia ginsengihumi]|uniref:UPF0738 family protein n=1 Tax=Heyndrickxia ginsengihumi TaxID=363870 RepID=UPI003D1C052B
MRTKIMLNQSEVLENSLGLYCDQPIAFSQLRPAGRMLVDSDECSFVYLTEDDKEYIYLYLPTEIWHDLQQALKHHKNVVAVSRNERLELLDFHEEMDYLISNIEGNSNYGEEFVAKVEAIFLAKTNE